MGWYWSCIVFVYEAAFALDDDILHYCKVVKRKGVLFEFVHHVPRDVPDWKSFSYVAILMDDIALFPRAGISAGTSVPALLDIMRTRCLDIASPALARSRAL